MANHKSCLKKLAVNKRRRAMNLKAIQLCKSNIKKLKNQTDKSQAMELLNTVYKQLDKISIKNRMHKNKCRRLKSTCAKIVNSLV